MSSGTAQALAGRVPGSADTSPVVTTSQVTALIHDFAASLGRLRRVGEAAVDDHPSLQRLRNTVDHDDLDGCGSSTSGAARTSTTNPARRPGSHPYPAPFGAVHRVPEPAAVGGGASADTERGGTQTPAGRGMRRRSTMRPSRANAVVQANDRAAMPASA
jgi:hypothetical protein